MAEESAVKVCVRVRPLIEREQTVESAEPAAVYWKADKQTIRPLDNGKSYSFDRVFSAEETTNQLYQDIAKPLVVSAVEGYNGTIFAYGQTASGKTFTMMGSNLTPGVIPLAMEDVFQTIKSCPKKEFLLRVSYLEIYNETVTDLLCDSWKRKPLEIHEGINKTVYVGDLVEELVRSPEQALAWIKKGEKNRHYGKTKMNQRSSRSHTIFRMILESRERSDPASGENADGAIFVSHLNLVDLAGSERASQTGAEGARLKEGCNINRSLFVLGQVIKKLSVSDENQRGFINYRDSKVTRILQNSLGGNAKTVIICTITPAAIEETIGTLQFASAAKNMKNDPHVTEVSDDGALLKRYRNEITELKRRLSEVSSVTQTTVTEKESLSQLLQEKDQLQREQEDRIKNLTKLLVTSSDFAPVKKVPKRRVTWGGKLLRSSVAETFSHEAKGQKLFTVGEQDEDAEDFDSRWDIPEEPIFDTEMDQSSVTVRSFSESPSRVNELSDKVSCLEQQLETETLQKREAMEKVESSERRIADLEKQLEEKSQMPTDEQEQMRKGFEESIQFCETLVSEKERISSERDYLKQELDIFREQTGNLQNDKTALQQELEERKEMDEFKSLEEESKREYERELQNDISTLKKSMETAQVKCQELEANLEATSEELKKKAEWAEELQSLSDKDLVQQVKQLRRSLDDAEGLSRDTKKEWAFLRSENISLKERDVTLTVGHEKMEAEVNSLHHQLETEKSRFKKMQSDLQRELQGVFDENTKLTTLLDGKVPKNILDSVVLERTVADLKKELETYREGERTLQAQVDDLSELQVLPDKVNSLMKQVCELTEDLCAVQADRDSLVSAKACSDEDAQQLRESFQSSQTQLEKLHTDLSSAELRENNLTQQCSDVTAQLETFRVELERSSVENSQLLNTVEESSLRLKASEEQQASIQAKFDEVQDLMEGLDVKLANSESIRSTEEQFGKELQEQIKQLSEQLECVRAERDHLLSEKTDGPQNHAEELQKLLSNVTSLTEEREQLQEILDGVREERNQLKLDVEENVEMMIENQEELRAALEKNREQQDKIQHLETAQMSQQNNITSEESSSPLEELQNHMRQLSEELECVRTERDRLLSEKTDGPQNHAEELEKLLSNVTCLTEERDQLQEILQGVREEKNQLKRDLEEMEMCVVTRSENSYGHEDIGQLLNSDQHTQISDSDPLLHEQMKAIGEELQCVRAERDRLLSEKTHSPQNHTEELEKLLSNVTSLTEERDQLQGILEGVREEKNQLKRDLEENMETILQIQAELKQQQHVDVELQMHGQQDAELQQQIQQLEGALKTMEQERNQLTIDLQQNMELTAKTQALVHSVQEEFKQERQLTSDLERRSLDEQSHLEQQLKDVREELECLQAERDHLRSEKTDSPQNHAEEVEKLLSNVTSLTEERKRLQEILEDVREEKNKLQRHIEDNKDTVVQVQAELKRQQQLNSEQQAEGEQQEVQLHQQIQALQRELETMQAERSQLKLDLQEKMEMAAETQGLLCSIQVELRQQRQLSSELVEKESQLEQRAKELSEELEGVGVERDRLQSESVSLKNHAEELQKQLSNVTCLTEERDQLQEILEGVREEKNQLKRDLEEKEGRVVMVQKELRQQQQINSELQAEAAQQEAQLKQQIQQLEGEQGRVREERTQLQRDLQDNMHMVLQVQTSLKEQQHLNSELQAERGQQEAQLKQQLMELEEKLQGYEESHLNVKAEVECSNQLLSEANQTISVLTEQINNLEHATTAVHAPAEGLGLRLEDSTLQLQGSFVSFKQFMGGLSLPKPLEKGLYITGRVEHELLLMLIPHLPKPVRKIFCKVIRYGAEFTNAVQDTMILLRSYVMNYQELFEALVQQDVAVFEDRRLQDVLLCRAQAPRYSVREEDLQRVWDLRLTQLIDHRRQNLLKMSSVLERLEENKATCQAGLSDELREVERCNQGLRVLSEAQPVDLSAVESLLEKELARRSAAAQGRRTVLQGLREEHTGLIQELERVREQADHQLREERSKTFTLLPLLENAPIKTEADLLKDNQQLVLLLDQSQTENKVMQQRVEQLEEDQIKADDRVSSHKQATQLLQTELQDACAQVHEREGAIQTLQEKLRETEAVAKRRASPSAVELEKEKAKVVKMEVEMTSLSTKHQEEILKMTTVLKHKEEALRKLRETLRKSQQEGEDSFMQGEDLHARLTTTRGRTVQSSVLLEKNKLEEEVRQLRKKIAELESLVSGQKVEITKWKGRALTLKHSRKDVVEKPLTPCTPTKRRHPMTLEGELLNSPKKFLNSPKKFLDSPKKFLDSPKKCHDSPKTVHLDSPKVLPKFFDVHPGSETSINCPKQFFDNSYLGTIPDGVVDKKEEWWPLSPKQADVCKPQ